MKNLKNKLASVILATSTNFWEDAMNWYVPSYYVEDYSKRPNLFIYIGIIFLIFILGIASQFKLSSPKNEKIKKYKNVLFWAMIALIIAISQVYVYNILTYEPSYFYHNNYYYYDYYNQLVPIILLVVFLIAAVVLKNNKEDEKSKILNKMSHVAVLIGVMCLEILIFNQISGLCDYSDYLDFYVDTSFEIITFVILGIFGIVLQAIALKSKRSILRKFIAILGIVIITAEVILAGNLILNIL